MFIIIIIITIIIIIIIIWYLYIFLGILAWLYCLGAYTASSNRVEITLLLTYMKSQKKSMAIYHYHFLWMKILATKS